MAWPRLALLLLLLPLCACTSWQERADTMQAELEASVAAGLTSKDGFTKRYGAPQRCAPLAEGEACEWAVGLGTGPNGRSEASGLLSVEFDGASAYVRGQHLIRRGPREYVGHAEPQDAVTLEVKHQKDMSRSVNDGTQRWFDRVWGR
jgi:hypothetical protein